MQSSEKQITQKINEFCDRGNLASYRDILYDIILEILNAKCKISINYDSYCSKHVSNEKNCFIQISLKRKYENPVQIVWTILHEFGHHLSGPIKKEDEKNIQLRRKSEEKAWEYAYQKIQKYPKLLIDIKDFHEFKEKELQSYNVKFNNVIY